MTHYIHYYNEQIGGGAGVRHVFVGSTYQRGRGIGAFLGGLARAILPYISKGARAVGKEAVRAGLNILGDVADGGTSFKESVNMRARESGRNLRKKAAKKISDMMKGSGYKSRAGKRKRQSNKTRGPGRVARKRPRKSKKKIKKSGL